MNSAHKKSRTPRRSTGVLLLVGALAGVTVGGGVGVIAAIVARHDAGGVAEASYALVVADADTTFVRPVRAF